MNREVEEVREIWEGRSMNGRQAVIDRIEETGIIAVIRAPDRESVRPLCRALLAGGVDILEITLSTPDAVGAIREMRELFQEEAVVGVGTVLTMTQAEAALEAGAQFLVTPILRRELVGVCHSGNCPVMLGAYTPTEAQLGHEAGADFIKIFPADSLGPAYIKAIRAPMPHLRIVPTGGVDIGTIPAFLDAGCRALGAGSSLVSAGKVRAGSWDEITRTAERFIQAVQSWRQANTNQSKS